MKRFLFGLAALPFLAGVSLAGQPVPLSDTQMDRVTAGFDFAELKIQNGGTVLVAINLPALSPDANGNPGCALTGCFLEIEGTPYPAGVRSFQLQAQFGP
jgi:hypothetical protein